MSYDVERMTEEDVQYTIQFEGRTAQVVVRAAQVVIRIPAKTVSML